MTGVGERIDKLGTYYVYFNISERYGLTFERFVEMVDLGSWEEFVSRT